MEWMFLTVPDVADFASGESERSRASAQAFNRPDACLAAASKRSIQRVWIFRFSWRRWGRLELPAHLHDIAGLAVCPCPPLAAPLLDEGDQCPLVQHVGELLPNRSF